MSVILDALHKARGDKTAQAEPQANSVARVLDATTGAPPAPAVSRPSRRREWFLAFAVIILMLMLFAAVGGGLLLLYNFLRAQDNAFLRSNVAEVARTPVLDNSAAAGMQPAVLAQNPGAVQADPGLLPTPVPLSELPIQPPAAASAAAPAAATVQKSDFTLGSIVCENNDCIASLNGRSVRVGDVVKGFTVAAIDSTIVTLQNATTGEEMTLSLFD